MDKTKLTATFEEKRDFLIAIMEAEEKRRDSVENKSSILIASNAILIGAMVGFILPLSANNNPLIELQVLLAILSLGSMVVSIIICAQVLSPLVTQGQRQRSLDLGSSPATEYNLLYFGRIAALTKQDYQMGINDLTSSEILQQLSSQVHNLSRILVSRYRNMMIAHVFFLVGAIGFLLISATRLFTP